MKSSTMRWMIAVAALAVAGSASAQTFTAKIPMPFRVNDSLMTPGSYEVRVASGNTGVEVLSLRNVDTNQAIMLLSGSKSDAPKQWLQEGTPRMAFECTGASCTLGELWNGAQSYAYKFRTPAPANVQARGTTTVTLAMIKVR